MFCEKGYWPFKTNFGQINIVTSFDWFPFINVERTTDASHCFFNWDKGWIICNLFLDIMFGELPIQIYLSVRERKNKNKIFISQEKKTHRICLSVLTFTRAVKYGLFVFYVIMLCLYNDARTPMSLISVFIQLHSLVKHDLWIDAIFSMKLKLQFQVFWVFKWM